MIKRPMRQLSSMHKLLFFILAFSLFSGCQSNIQASAPQTKSVVLKETFALGQLDTNTLYDLLVADLAFQQQDFTTALDLYLTQAKQHKNTKLAQQATHLAIFKGDEQRLEQAISIWHTLDSKQPEANFIYTLMLLGKGKYTLALDNFNLALTHKSQPIFNSLSKQIRKLNKTQLNAYQKLIKTHTKKNKLAAQSWFILGQIYSQQKQTKIALEAYNSSLKLEPKNTQALANKAKLLAKNQKYKAALESLELALTIKPQDTRLNLLKTDFLFASKQPEKALEQALSSTKNQPKDNILKFFTALFLLDNKEENAAGKLFEQLTKTKYKQPEVQFYLGVLAAKNNKLNKAQTHWLKINQAELNYRAMLLLSKLAKASDQALLSSTLKQIKTQTPKLKMALYYLEINWLIEKNLTALAKEKLEQALNAKPKSSELLYLAATKWQQLNPERSNKYLEQLLKRNPKHAYALNHLGYNLVLSGKNYSRAQQLLNQALSIEPNNPAFLDSMGWLLHKQKRYAEANLYLEQAHKLDSDEEISNHLIYNYCQLQQPNKAKRLLKKLQQPGKKQPHLQQTQKLIKDGKLCTSN